MSEQVKRYVSTRLLPDASTWNVSGAAHTYVRISDYDALHAEAEALRAENGRLSQQLAQSDSALRESRANDMANVRTLEDMWERHDALRQELEAARVLLERASSILGSQGYGAWDSLAAEIDALLTATPAPEVQAEQGERQQAVEGLEFAIVNRGPYRILEWHGDNGCRPASDEECALWDALMSPQPGPDVRGLVEALDDACEEFELRGLHDLRAYKNLKQHHADLSNRQAQRKA